jgi:hypothetical protein
LQKLLALLGQYSRAYRVSFRFDIQVSAFPIDPSRGALLLDLGCRQFDRNRRTESKSSRNFVTFMGQRISKNHRLDEDQGRGFMSGPDSSNANETGNSNAGKLLLAVLLLGIAVALFFAARVGNDRNGRKIAGGGDGASPETSDRLDLTRTALAATENFEMVEAEVPWSLLFAQTPQDASVALNRAINRVLWVDQLSAQVTDASRDDAEKKAARSQLPDAISRAREAIDAFAGVADDEVMPMWLRTRIDLHEASLQPGSMTKSLRKKVYEQLSEAINGEVGKNPSAIILGGSLIQVIEQMEDPIDGLPADVLSEGAKTIGALSNQHPGNLFFTLRAARLNIAGNNKRAAEFVARASNLTRAIEPSIRRETKPIGVTPDELVAEITAAIESEDWSEAENRMLLWFNILINTEIVKADRRRALPHPLDRLSFDSLRRLSAEMAAASPLTHVAGEIKFEPTTIATSKDITLVQTIDFDLDLDLDPDLVSVNSDGLVQLWSNDRPNRWPGLG